LINLGREQKIELIALLEEKDRRKAKTNLLDYTAYTMSTFEPAPFHKAYYHVLDLFIKGDIKRLMITMPPQHGKSEGSTRRLPSKMLGIDPDRKIAVASYNATFARKFNRDIQRIIDDKEYYKLFPDTVLNESNVVTVSDSYLRNSEEFEIVNHRGSLKAVGRGGSLTGNPLDVMIMDDVYKDYAEGNSPVIRDAVWDWYTSVVKTRLHNDSQELIVFTRWHEDDLIGRLEKKENVIEIDNLEDLDGLDPRDWVKINFEAIKTGDPTGIDPREKGEPLWKEKHSLTKLEDARALDPEQFNCLYQGNPMSSEGRLYKDFKTYSKLPDLRIIKNYTDTADTGEDYLCSINYGESLSESDDHLYVLDVLYTQDPMEITEVETARMIREGNVNECKIESNNGGRSFARTVEKDVSAVVNWFHQSKNKEARIYSNSAKVNSTVVFPDDWHVRWPDFFNHVVAYKKLFKANKHDDAPDVLTGMVEEIEEIQGIIGW